MSFVNLSLSCTWYASRETAPQAINLMPFDHCNWRVQERKTIQTSKSWALSKTNVGDVWKLWALSKEGKEKKKKRSPFRRGYGKVYITFSGGIETWPQSYQRKWDIYMCHWLGSHSLHLFYMCCCCQGNVQGAVLCWFVNRDNGPRKLSPIQPFHTRVTCSR